MSRRDNRALRCARCRMLGGLCVCALIPSPPLVTRTRLALFLHREEARKPTNTGQLAAACLANHEIHERGHRDQPSAPFVAARGSIALLLFPHEDAAPLTAADAAGPPITLIVPDGTWRQAAKVRARVPGLRDLRCVALPPGEPTRYRLRSEPVDGGLATFEAIARALEILEGERGPGVRAAMDALFLTMVERTLWARGQLGAAEVTTGLPPGVVRHDPARGRA